MFSEVIALGVTQSPVDNGRELLPWLISSLIYFILFMVCPSDTLDLLECGVWCYYSCFDKLPIGSGQGLSAKVRWPASELLGKPKLVSQSLDP